MSARALAVAIVFLAIFSVFASAQDTASRPKQDTPDEKTIRALIADLGHESFDKRDAAHKRLLGIGGPALELLKKAAKENKDAEARERALQLLEEIQETQLSGVGAEFYFDFRKQTLPDKRLRLIGPRAVKLVQAEPTGLRVTLPGEKNVDAIGVAVEYRVKGDFEITAGYEVLKADKPNVGWRVGFELYLITDTTTKEALAFDHGIRQDGANVYVCSRMTTIDGKRLNAYKQPDVPATGKSGWLRIVRTGSKATLSVLDEPSKGFRVVHRADLGKEDIKLIRLAGNPGGAGNAVEVRLVDVRVRSADADGLKPTGVNLPGDR